MVISRKHKAIFIHVPRTGGSSIESQGIFSIEQGPTHDPIDVVAWQLRPERIDDYFCFAFVRNPFDWFVSLYHYFYSMGITHRWYWNNKKVVQEVKQFPDFRAFCREFSSLKCRGEYHYGVCHFLPQSHYLVGRSGKCELDFVGRFEQLLEDWGKVAVELGVSAKLPHVNASDRGAARGADYRSYYDDQSRALVEEYYAEDLQRFGYEF